VDTDKLVCLWRVFDFSSNLQKNGFILRKNLILSESSKEICRLDLALNTGLRQVNQYSLAWNMVDWQRHMLHIPRTKNGESLHVPLNDAALAALRAVCTRANESGRAFTSERTGEPLEHPRHWFNRAVREGRRGKGCLPPAIARACTSLFSVCTTRCRSSNQPAEDMS
jgi:integrase